MITQKKKDTAIFTIENVFAETNFGLIIMICQPMEILEMKTKCCSIATGLVLQAEQSFAIKNITLDIAHLRAANRFFVVDKSFQCFQSISFPRTEVAKIKFLAVKEETTPEQEWCNDDDDSSSKNNLFTLVRKVAKRAKQ